MILWIFALLLLAAVGLVGYYQGAIRVAFSLVGIFVAVWLCLPLSSLLKPLLPIFEIKHPILISFVAPAIMFVVIMAIFKTGALLVHKKVMTWYKYKGSGTQQSLFERVNQRVGICLGLVNATVYFVLLTAVAYVLGYFTIQVASADTDSASLRLVNSINADMKATGMDKAVAGFVPATETYYDTSDILGLIYHNPLLQSRLSSYPVFLTLAERKEFKELGDDTRFQEFWQKHPTVGELVSHEKVKPLVDDVDLYTNVVAMLGGDLKDLKGYLETGKSAKYDDEPILAKWTLNAAASASTARQAKPNMGVTEMARIKTALRGLANSTFTATIDKKAVMRIPVANAPTIQGTWKSEGGGKYRLMLYDGSKNIEVGATATARRLTFTKDNLALVFDK